MEIVSPDRAEMLPVKDVRVKGYIGIYILLKLIILFAALRLEGNTINNINIEQQDILNIIET